MPRKRNKQRKVKEEQTFVKIAPYGTSKIHKILTFDPEFLRLAIVNEGGKKIVQIVDKEEYEPYYLL